MLIMPNAIPIGKKAPILPLTTLNIMKMSPLITKRIAAVLYDFLLLDVVLFTIIVNILYWASNLVYSMLLR